MTRGLLLLTLLLAGCGAQVEETLPAEPPDASPHWVTIEIDPLAGGTDYSNAHVAVTYDDWGGCVDYEFDESGKAACPIDLGKIKASTEVKVEILHHPYQPGEELDPFYLTSFPIEIPLVDLETDEDGHVTVEIPIALNLQGILWECTSEIVVAGEQFAMQKKGQIEMTPGDTGVSLDPIFLGESVQIVGQKIFGETSTTVYEGWAESNVAFEYTRTSKTRVGEVTEVVCWRGEME